MKAILCKAWGEPNTLVLEDVTLPPPAPGQAKIKVKAASANFADALLIQGKYQLRPPHPFTPGMEFAGIVLEVGEGVTNVKPGDEVMGITDYGAYAEEVNATAATLLPKPPQMDFPTAAAFPIVYGTSHIGLWHRAKLQPGETVLVFGAAGGVGLTAVEIAKHMGATVIACASTPEKLELTRKYGADHTINYKEENIRDRVKQLTGGKGADVIYDPVGGEAFNDAMRAVAWEGRVLVVGFASGIIPDLAVNLTLVKNCSVVGVYWGAYARQNPAILVESLQTLATWYAQGTLKPHISETYALADAPQALDALLNRTSMGKMVIIP